MVQLRRRRRRRGCRDQNLHQPLNPSCRTHQLIVVFSNYNSKYTEVRSHERVMGGGGGRRRVEGGGGRADGSFSGL